MTRKSYWSWTNIVCGMIYVDTARSPSKMNVRVVCSEGEREIERGFVEIFSNAIRM